MIEARVVETAFGAEMGELTGFRRIVAPVGVEVAAGALLTMAGVARNMWGRAVDNPLLTVVMTGPGV